MPHPFMWALGIKEATLIEIAKGDCNFPIL